MISDNQMISRRQASWVIFLNMLAGGLFSLSVSTEAIPPVAFVMSGLLAVMLVIGYHIFFFRLLAYCEKRTGCDWQTRRMPYLLIVFLLVLNFMGLVWALQFFCNVIGDRVPVENAWIVPSLFMLAALIYGAGKGIEVRGRMAEWLGGMIVIPVLLLFVLGMWQVFKSGNWRLLSAEQMSVNHWDGGYLWVKNSLGKAAFLLLGDHPLLLWRCIRKKDGTVHMPLGGFVAAGIFLMFSVVLTALMLSPEGMTYDRYPFGVVLQLIRFPGNFISRYDIFFVMLWMMSYFIFAGGMLLWMAELLQQLIIGKSENKKVRKRLAILLGTLVLAVLLCGCYAEREPQNRHYIMCMGIDVGEKEEGWTISYGFPDLAALTGTDAGEAEPVRVFHAATIEEGAKLLDASSDKTTDYSQMPVIIIGKKLLEDDEAMQKLIRELTAEKSIRRTALIACAKENAEDILKLDKEVQGSVGVFIYELCQNNYENKGCTMRILEDFAGTRSGRQSVIPVLDSDENIPEVVQLIYDK